jgi:hypothetical protein
MNKLPTPIIRKAKRVIGKTLAFRDAGVNDAELILSLRLDKTKSKYLSAVSADLGRQQVWLEEYSKSEDQAYFIIEYQSEPIGTIRIYDSVGLSFCWGSWILKGGIPSHAAIESALMVYAYALDDLCFQAAHFDVRKGNDRVWQFHERFGAERIAETDLDYLYKICCGSINESRKKYKKFLPHHVVVTR